VEGDTAVEKVKLIGAILLFAYAILFFYTNVIEGQTTLRDVPLVSDKEIAVKDSTVRVVGKDEIQRISNKFSERIQRLENEMRLLELRVNQLEDQDQGE
jgi:sensor histidine kinase YesM